VTPGIGSLRAAPLQISKIPVEVKAPVVKASGMSAWRKRKKTEA